MVSLLWSVPVYFYTTFYGKVSQGKIQELKQWVNSFIGLNS